MILGRYKVTVINSGFFKLDGGAMFGIIPKPLWEKSNPSDQMNRIQLATRNLLLESGRRKILVDTGMGDKWDDKSRSIYAVDQSCNSLYNELSRLNIKPSEITDVILTHLHFDHTGGSTIYDNGKIVPAFPNARYYVQKKNFEWAMNPSDRDKGSYLKENFLPLFNEGVLFFLEGEEQFDNEICMIEVNGHTFSQQLVKISDGLDTYLYCCDLLPTASHIHIPYVMGYDLQPLVTVAEKKKILAQAVDENWKLIFEHDADTAAATILLNEKGYKVNERFSEI